MTNVGTCCFVQSWEDGGHFVDGAEVVSLSFKLLFSALGKFLQI